MKEFLLLNVIISFILIMMCCIYIHEYVFIVARQQPLPQYVPQSNPVPQGQIPVHQRHGPVPQGHIPVPQGYVPVSDQPPAYTQGIYPTANDSGT